ncbi:hypothetical protein PENSPDRAFT_416280 [Peniophora sp. CONT]|nr:hypothetical protein PENSPDRAFT_416280 [Peniophora sp. CONT]
MPSIPWHHTLVLNARPAAVSVSTSDELISSLSTVTTRWCEVIRASDVDGIYDDRPDVYRILTEMYVCAEEGWYTSLLAMPATHTEEERTSSERYRRVVQCWVNPGEAFRINEDEERIKNDAVLARLCSWATCVHHYERTEEALPICKGCGEVRYCSRECQRRDWKEGGHRAKCRRLKS